MKKGLRKTLIVLEKLFIFLAVLGVALLIRGLISVCLRTYGNDMFAEAIIKALCIAVAMEILCSVLMILSLHIFVGGSHSANPANSVLHKVCLGTAAAANLLFYVISFLTFVVKYGAAILLQISFVLWLLCVIVCVASLILITVKNAKAKRIRKASEGQDETAADGTNKQLS